MSNTKEKQDLPAAPAQGQREVYAVIPVSERNPTETGYFLCPGHGFLHWNQVYKCWEPITPTHWLELQTQAPALPVPDTANEAVGLICDCGDNANVDDRGEFCQRCGLKAHN